jgi:hypothetical protein
MNAWIVLEGQSDLAVMKALLPDEIQSVVEFIAVGGRSNISSIARTVLVKHKAPVAVVVDSDSSDYGVSASSSVRRHAVQGHPVRTHDGGDFLQRPRGPGARLSQLANLVQPQVFQQTAQGCSRGPIRQRRRADDSV